MKFILCLILVSCSVMNKEECENANWHKIGMEDGKRGYDVSRFNSRKKACVEHGVSADSKKYNQGRTAGIKIYCESLNAFKLGSEGKGFPEVCSKFSNKKRDYNRGIAKYCSYENGYELGFAGKTADDTCDREKFAHYYRGHYTGKKAFKEKEEARKRESLRLVQMERMLGNQRRQVCSSKIECTITSSCVENKCQNTQKSCAYPSECDIEGSCLNSVCKY